MNSFYLFAMKSLSFAASLGILASLLVALRAEPETPGGAGFAAPEQALKALQHAVEVKDQNQLRAIFGPEINEIANQDPVEATNEFVAVARAMNESSRIVDGEEGRKLIEYGNDKTLFPVPLVKKDGQWYFDTAEGKEELINRRIGRNELETLDVVRTYVQAQRDYASADRDDDEVLEYAQRFGSSPGKKDGLFWRPEIDGTISPLGPLVAEAEAVGYTKKTEQERQAFHGYFFRILTRQGKHAPGGAYDYIINGNMIGGFALVAWPAEYGETGVMTFIVNQQGRVYQKDLGSETSKIAEATKAYDPDSTWSVSKE